MKQKTEPKHRLILLGNGFDLAHGLPTSYEDFIFTICKYEILDCLKDPITLGRKFLNPNFIELKDSKIQVGNVHDAILTQITNKQDLVRLINNQTGLIKFFKNKTLKYLNTPPEQSYIKCSNSFVFDLIAENNGKNWSDIESYFYAKLVSCLGIKNADDKITKNKDEILYDVKELNDEIKEVKFELENYLREHVEDKYIFKPQKEFINIFKGNRDIESTLLLNFNYTKTAEIYLPHLQKDNSTKLIQIHGKLGHFRDNPMIFGFGDEYDKLYKVFEEFNANSLFEHIKSFGYFKSDSYNKMESFIESEPYEIFVIGHSCGLSDRTLLKYLFEHEHCKSIKIFYYAGKDTNFHISRDNHNYTAQEISRHFEDKAKMRSKIINFQKSEPCPQTPLVKKVE